jgi:hypothetical protein
MEMCLALIQVALASATWQSCGQRSMVATCPAQQDGKVVWMRSARDISHAWLVLHLVSEKMGGHGPGCTCTFVASAAFMLSV